MIFMNKKIIILLCTFAIICFIIYWLSLKQNRNSNDWNWWNTFNPQINDIENIGSIENQNSEENLMPVESKITVPWQKQEDDSGSIGATKENSDGTVSVTSRDTWSSDSSRTIVPWQKQEDDSGSIGATKENSDGTVSVTSQ